MSTIKIGMYEVNEQLIIRYYNVLKAIFHDGGNNFTEYGRRRTKIHNEILTSVRLKRTDDEYVKFNVALDNYLQDLFRIDNFT